MPTIQTAGELSIGYKGKMFGQPQCKYQLVHDVPEGDTPEETKMLVESFKKLFAAAFEKLAKHRASAVKKAMDDTEKAMTKKMPSDPQNFVSTANKLIQQGVDVWRNVEVPRLAEECLAKCYDYVEQKLKRKITKKKVKTVLKIVAIVLITLAVAGISIAATVLSGGATAAIVAAALVAAAGAAVSIGKTIKKEYDSYNNYLGKVADDAKKISEAIAYQNKKQDKLEKGGKLGPKERIKLVLSGTAGHEKSLRKHLKAAEERMVLLTRQLPAAMDKAQEARAKSDQMETHPDKAMSKEAAAAKAAAYSAERALDKLLTTIQAFRQVQAEAEKQLAELKNKGEFKHDALNSKIAAIQKHQDTVEFLFKSLSSLASGGMKIMKAMK